MNGHTFWGSNTAIFILHPFSREPIQSIQSAPHVGRSCPPVIQTEVLEVVFHYKVTKNHYVVWILRLINFCSVYVRACINACVRACISPDLSMP